MRKPYFYFLAGFGSVVIAIGAFLGFIFVLNLLLEDMFAADQNSNTNVIATTPSPNQQHTATVFTSMGGGAAGWCYVAVSIRKSDEQFSRKENVVFSSSCGTEIKTQWEGDGILRVSYSSDDEILSLLQKGWNVDKTVRIFYLGK